MGNIFAKNESKISTDVHIASDLKQYIENIPKSMETVSTLQNKVAELKKQNKALKKLLEIERQEKAEIRNQLLNKTKSENTKSENTKSENTKSEKQESKEMLSISKHKIEEFVDKMLKDPNVNIGYIPDFAERKIYINIFGIILGLMDNLIDTTKVEFMGHKITFDLSNSEN